MYKRRYRKVHKHRVPLTNNREIASSRLESTTSSVLKTLCTHEIGTAGPNFKLSSNFLKLSNTTM